LFPEAAILSRSFFLLSAKTAIVDLDNVSSTFSCTCSESKLIIPLSSPLGAMIILPYCALLIPV
jgi:hypothetical protein